jgi:hypothetical protein
MPGHTQIGTLFSALIAQRFLNVIASVRETKSPSE